MIKLIRENQEESRKEWLINSFKKAALQKSNAHQHQFWQHDNHPKELWTASVIDKKINYIHDNPVDAGFVEKPHEYAYSSARDYADIKGLVKIITV
jgi:putative transposase